MSVVLKDVEKVMIELSSDLEKVRKELKRIQSVKCRLKKQKFKKSYEKEMIEVLKREQVVKEVRQLLEPKEKCVPDFQQEDVDQLDYDQTVKAIRSIQSKKTLSKYLTEVECENEEYRNAVRVENMLLEHRKKVQPVDDLSVRKTQIESVIEVIESNEELSKETLLDLLKKLTK